MVKVSVVVPVYRLARYVRSCIESLVAQIADFEFEIIACDDGSPDDSLAILRELAAAHDNLTVLDNRHNRGLAGTMRRLLTSVQGDYVAYMDGDDIAYPGKLQALADHLDERPNCAIAYHEAQLFDSESGAALRLYSRDNYNFEYVPPIASVHHLIRYGCILNASSAMFRRHGRMPEAVDGRCRILLDYPFHILNALFLEGSIDRIDGVFTGYRIHAESFGGQTLASPERRIQVLADQERACRNAHRFGVDERVIAQGIAHHRFATALYFLKLGRNDLFQRYIDAASADGFFFDDRHRLAARDMARPADVRQALFPELAA